MRGNDVLILIAGYAFFAAILAAIFMLTGH